MTFLTVFIAGLILLIYLLVFFVKRSQTYWTRNNVPSIKTSSLFGNVENPFNVKDGLLFRLKQCYDEFRKRNEKYGGLYFFTEKIFMPVDPDLIKNVLAKDFSHFHGHGFTVNEKIDPLTAHLFNLQGEKWRNMRIKLSPTFTSGKMKMMFQTLLDCGIPLMSHVDTLCRNGEDLDVKEILACYTTDIIGSCAFGLECNSFKDPNAEFRTYGRRIFAPRFKNILLQFVAFISPAFILKSFPFKRIPLDIETFFVGIIKNIMDYRVNNKLWRNDFIQLFIEMQEQAKVNGTKALTIEQISAQAFGFFQAGFETSSTTMTFCLHELAFNQNVQDVLRKEIREALRKNNDVLTYDAIMDMKYMDKVVNEALRKYPPVSMINRVCSLDYKIPESDFTLEAGTKVLISTLGVHRDTKYYPEPEKFDPERFSDENKAKRPAFTFLPFGEGPRICIGFRFGLMQTKTGLSMLLDKYKILPAEGATYTFECNPKSFILTKKGKIMLRAERLTS